jgi:energy-coupling factor transport system ATP-binding protein
MNNFLNVENACFNYPNSNSKIITNLNLNFKGRNSIFIIGDNGKGKTTLGKLLCGLLQPTNGKIKINNLEISKLNSRKKIKHAFYIEQRNYFQFFKSTLEEEIKLSEKISKNRRDEKLYSKIFIDERTDLNPLELSINQAWRFLLFISTIYNSSVLFIDEIPSASNSKNIKALENLLEERNNKELITFISNQRLININFNFLIEL